MSMMTFSHPRAAREVRSALLWLGMVSGLVSAGAAHAQQVPERRNVVSFSTSATREIRQDLLIITLQARREGSVASEVQSALKQQLEAALGEARKAEQPEGMEVRTGAFSIQPRYTNQGRISGWQGQAQLVLQGTDMARIAQTAGRLNDLNVVQVSYGLSCALRERQESELTAQAIASFRSRAQDTAKAFGFAHYVLGEVSIQSGEPGFDVRAAPMLMRASLGDAAASAPVPVEPGKGQVTVTVAGQVILTP